MEAKDFRNAILQEAVQGKLVPQIKSEGTASELLKQFFEKRDELVKKGLVNKEKKLPDIKKEEVPFEIPESWCWVKLNSLANITKLAGFEYSEYIANNLKPDGIPLFKGQNVRDTSISYEFDSFISEELSNKLSRSQITKKCLLTPYVGAGVGNVGIHNKEGKFHLGSNVGKIEILLNNIGIEEYILIVLKSNYGYKEMTKHIKATGIPSISIDALRDVNIPLPPLFEQKRIVQSVERFIPLINKFENIQKELHKINQTIGISSIKAILQEAMQGRLVEQLDKEGNAESLITKINEKKEKAQKDGKIKKEKALAIVLEDDIPFDIPENWRWIRLSDACNMYTGDSINETEKKLKYTNIPEGRFYIGTKDVGFDKTINYDNGVKIPYDKTNFSIAPKNSVLLCIEGGSAGRKIAFTEHDVCFGNKLCCFDFYEPEFRQFIYYYLQSPMFTNAFRDRITGIIGGVSIGKLKAMPLPVPPMEEQKRIVAAIEKLLPLCEKLGQ